MKKTLSIVIPTFNSEATIEMVLQSIRKQTMSQKLIEVLLLDGGSTDQTLAIAKKYNATIIQNPKQHQVYAKHLGHLLAKGTYIMHLDSDEVLENKKSLEIKIAAFKKDPRIKGFVPSGHKTPTKVSPVNKIINEFGDPFSFYMYGFSFNWRFFIKQLKASYRTVFENKDYVVIDFENAQQLPGLEMSATGMILDREYLNNTFPKLSKQPHLISQVFYMLVERGDFIGFEKNDPVIHYSAGDWGKYLKKIKARVLNNVYQTDMGKSAFSGRSRYYSKTFTLKKYLFIPYSLTLVLPAIQGVYLSVSRQSVVFLSFPLLCLYICFLTMYYMTAKFLGIKPIIKGYGF